MRLKEIGEIKALEELVPIVAGLGKDVLVGAGDDCAVVEMPSSGKYELLLKADSIIETVHFGKETDPHLIGKKAVCKVLSDIAAMGGKPLWILISLVANKNAPFIMLRKIYEGIKQMALKYKTAVVGGETSQGKLLELHIFCAGIVKKGKAVLRSGAKEGDLIYVTGTLGGSIYGKHLNFEPRLAEGAYLAERSMASSMIDITDGLLMDLKRILKASNKSCKLYSDRIPISSILLKKRIPYSEALKKALTDGEDFELLFTVPRYKARLLEKSWRFGTKISLIGEVENKRCSELILIDTNGRIERNDFTISKNGYEHFRE